MLRIPSSPRPHWQQQALEYGFNFHTIGGAPYWDESAYYQFTLAQIEQDLEAPTEELHQMCLALVDKACKDDELLRKLRIPQRHWQALADSWQRRDQSLYSRMDFAYDGNGPAKLLENNADTPTSLYETGFWQWLWLQDMVDAGRLSRAADQFNSLQEKLVERFAYWHAQGLNTLHFSCCQDSDEDRGTVQYLQDCAIEAGITCPFVFVEEIGIAANDRFTDGNDEQINALFKLYPWEFMLREAFAEFVDNGTHFIEPMWKAILSNKGILPLLWEAHPNHPNLLPAWFEDDLPGGMQQKLVKKPLYSREGGNISILERGQTLYAADGPYGEEGFIYQAFAALPRFANCHTLIGSWLVNDKAAGISVREDASLITQDSARYLPHIILG